MEECISAITMRRDNMYHEIPIEEREDVTKNSDLDFIESIDEFGEV